MRSIKHLVIHCTATQPSAKVSSILNYWKQKLGWKSPGYHFIIAENGKVTQLLDVSKVSNGVRGYNAHSINISYIGGVDSNGKPKDTRTAAQYVAMESLIKELYSKYPSAKILGHRDFKGVKKACPSFDVATFLKQIKL